jgi:hypothetical protein
MKDAVLAVYFSGAVAVLAATVIAGAMLWRAGTPFLRYHGDHFKPDDVVGVVGIGTCCALVWPLFIPFAVYLVRKWLRK